MSKEKKPETFEEAARQVLGEGVKWEVSAGVTYPKIRGRIIWVKREGTPEEFRDALKSSTDVAKAARSQGKTGGAVC